MWHWLQDRLGGRPPPPPPSQPVREGLADELAEITRRKAAVDARLERLRRDLELLHAETRLVERDVESE